MLPEYSELIALLRELVGSDAGVSTTQGDDDSLPFSFCAYCGAGGEDVYIVIHEADCPITRGRKLLGLDRHGFPDA